MQLLHIRESVCPHCGSRVVYEEQSHQHCNGQWFETRKFECGHIIKHSPNFERNEVITKCPKSENMVIKKEKRKTALNSVNEFIERLDVDRDYKRKLLDYLKYA